MTMKNIKLFFNYPLLFILSYYGKMKARKKMRKIKFEFNLPSQKQAFLTAFEICLSLMYCCKIYSPRKSISFCFKMIEETKNSLLDEINQKVVLHNMNVGRIYFESLLPTIHRQFFESSFFVDELYRQAINSKSYLEKENIDNKTLIY